jgi:lysine N6-hydroxylase
MDSPAYDAIGIGIGPFNLSAAALCEPVPGLKTIFLDRNPQFAWHPGLLLSGATIQTSHLKDLVTLADPQSKYTFLAYLHSKQRMYRFITANFGGVERVEFDDYFRWVADRLSNLRFGTAVENIGYDGARFIINDDARYTARSVILATGLRPTIPSFAEPLLGNKVFHGQALLKRAADWRERRVAVIGGGQSGAEVLNHLLSQEDSLPRTLYWVSSRDNFLPLDDSPFTNELFTPGYSNYFFDLPANTRLFCLQSQTLASDGISMKLLQDIYRKLYCFEFLRSTQPRVALRAHTRLAGLFPTQDGDYAMDLQHILTGKRSTELVDMVILCTGYHYEVPKLLEPLRSRIRFSNGTYEVNRDFSIEWDGSPHNKIYVQNAAINARGIADPNLSLMAWRSANIVNDLLGHPYYQVQDSKDLQLWT